MEKILNQILEKVSGLDEKVSSLDAKVSSLDAKVSSLDAKVSSLDAKVSTLDSKVSTLDAKVSSLDSKVSTLDEKVSNLDTKVSGLESQVKENTLILRALEHKADVNKAEHDNFTHQLARIEGKTENLSTKLDAITKDLTFVEHATGKNIIDIAMLKQVR